MVLNLLLQDHEAEHNSGPYEIAQCQNGYEAFMEAQNTKYDLILMDIMMPVMDGIESTRKIREIDKEVMIIAVSAVEDRSKQDEILRNGAEDYIHKPINAKQLFSRLESYFSLLPLRHRETISQNSKAVNLYTRDIFHRQIIFYVENEEALAEFWEYYLLNDEGLKVDSLSDVVRAVFSLGDTVLKLDAKPWIIVEENKDTLYFTLNKLDRIDSTLLKLLLIKNKEVESYKHNDDKISFKLEKKIGLVRELPEPEERAVQTEVAQNGDEHNSAKATVKKDVEIKATDMAQYRIYNYMDPDDLNETESLLDDLSSMMLMLGNSDLESSEIDQISNYLADLGKHMSIYTESYAIGRALSNLSQEIMMHKTRFHDIASDLSTLSSAFTSDLQSWLKLTFYQGAPSVDFMNDTIVVNCDTIISMLRADDSVESGADLDDIFDF